MSIIKLTNGPKHHFFGFHDLCISNFDDSKILSLEIERINRPPLSGEKVGVGYISEQRYIKIGETNAFNYPQGARMQWFSKTNKFTFNIQNGNHWGAALYDADINKLVDKFDSTIHVLTGDGRFGFGLDYHRLHRLGGYGYIGLPDPYDHDNAPSMQGVWILDTLSKEKKLLVSVKEVAECDSCVNNVNSYPNYLTHIVLNPSNTKLAFLHRYFLPDGGFMTRLMTIGLDGSNLRCLICGNLSHFDWKDDNTIYIWGRANSSLDTIRNNPLFNNYIMSTILQQTKNVIRKVIKSTTTQFSSSFLIVSDEMNTTYSTSRLTKLVEDGHPMTCPSNRDWCVIDTYPNSNKERKLMLYQFSTNEVLLLGTFRMLDDQPDRSLEKQYTKGIDRDVLSKISKDLVAFTRSGLHCDLHPRWFHNGKTVAFDSIHEGTRQIYAVDVTSLINVD